MDHTRQPPPVDSPPQYGLRRVPVYRPVQKPVMYQLIPESERWLESRRGFLQATALSLGSAVGLSACGGGKNGNGGEEGLTDECIVPTLPQLSESEYRLFTDTEIRAHAASVRLLAFSSDGNLLASAGGGPGCDHAEVKLWSMPDGKLFANVSDEFPAAALQFSDDGSQLHTPGGNFSVNTWNLDSLDIENHTADSVVNRVFGQTWVVRNGAVKTGSWYFIGDDYYMQLSSWDLVSGVKHYEVADLVGGPIYSVLLDPFGRQIAIAYRDGSVQLYEASGTRDLLHSFSGHAEPPIMAFSPDGGLLATGGGAVFASSDANPDLGDTTIKLWNTQTGTLLHTLTGHTNRINSLAFNGDGTVLVSGSGGNGTSSGSNSFTTPGVNTNSSPFDENSARVWDVASGTELLALTDHSHPIRAVAISPDGQFVAAGSKDNTIKVWRLSDASFLSGLFDTKALESDKTVNYVATELADGQAVQRALPVNTELPSPAGCTCNCVAGDYERKNCNPGGGGPCALVCVCIPVTFPGFF